MKCTISLEASNVKEHRPSSHKIDNVPLLQINWSLQHLKLMFELPRQYASPKVCLELASEPIITLARRWLNLVVLVFEIIYKKNIKSISDHSTSSLACYMMRIVLTIVVLIYI